MIKIYIFGGSGHTRRSNITKRKVMKIAKWVKIAEFSKIFSLLPGEVKMGKGVKMTTLKHIIFILFLKNAKIVLY